MVTTELKADTAQLIRDVASLMDEHGISKLTFNKVDDHVKVEGTYFQKFDLRYSA